MPKISIVIPIFNVEKYLNQCLESLENQTLKDIEIICVNDGSVDESLKIVEGFATKDKRFKVINQENQGIGVARNRGLDVATGEYLMFVDADDWIDLELCEKAYNQITRNGNDMVMFNFQTYSENDDEYEVAKWRIAPFAECFDEPKIELKNFDNYIRAAYLWSQIYSMDFVKRNNIRFPELRFAEDVFFYVKAVVLAKDISIINEPLYFYRKQSNSITKNFIAYYQALIDVRREMLDFVESLENKDCYIYPYLIYSINSLIHWYWVAANAKIPNLKYLKEFYTQITLFFSEISKKYDVEKIKNEINYKMFSRFCMHSFEKHHFYSLAKRIVTISNSRDKKRKIISILGMKFKIRKSLFLRKINIS